MRNIDPQALIFVFFSQNKQAFVFAQYIHTNKTGRLLYQARLEKRYSWK
jgi:hypothetical protein